MYKVEEYNHLGWQVVGQYKYLGEAYDHCLKIAMSWGTKNTRLRCPNGFVIEWEKKNVA